MPLVFDKEADQPKGTTAPTPSFGQRFITSLASNMGASSEEATAQKFAPGTHRDDTSLPAGLLWRPGQTGEERYYPQGDWAQYLARGLRDTLEGGAMVTGAIPGAVVGAAAGVPEGPAGVVAGGTGGAMLTGGLAAAGIHEGINAVSGMLGAVDKRTGSQHLWDTVMSGVQGALNVPLAELTSAGMRGLGLLGMRLPAVGAEMELRPGASNIAKALTADKQPIGINTIFQKAQTPEQKALAGYTTKAQEAVGLHPGQARAAAIENLNIGKGGGNILNAPSFDPVRQQVADEAVSKGEAAGGYFTTQDEIYRDQIGPFLQQNGKTKFLATDTYATLLGPMKKWATSPEMAAQFGMSDPKSFIALYKANGQLTLEQMVDLKQAVGASLRRDTIRGGMTVRADAERLYGALSNDIETVAKQTGNFDNLQAANAVYAKSMEFARMLGNFVKGDITSQLQPESVSSLRTVLSPSLFDAWAYKALDAMGTKAATVKGEIPKFDLGTFLQGYNSLDPATKDMMFKWSQGGNGSLAGKQSRATLDHISELADKSQMFGTNVPSSPPNMLVDAFRKLEGPAAKAVLQMFMSVGPDTGTVTNPILRSNQRAMQWIAKGFTLDPKDATGRMAWTLAAPSTELKQALYNQWVDDQQKSHGLVFDKEPKGK